MMFAIALAAGISDLMTADTIYTLKLRRRGIDTFRGRPANIMEQLKVSDAMRPVPAPLPGDSLAEPWCDRLAAEGMEALPVVDDQGAYRGS